MIFTDRRTSLSFQRFQYLACTFVCAYGATAARPLYIRYSCSQLQKSGEASQNGLSTSSTMMRMFMGFAVSPQWFSSVTFTPTFPPWSAMILNDSMQLARYLASSSLFG